MNADRDPVPVYFVDGTDDLVRRSLLARIVMWIGGFCALIAVAALIVALVLLGVAGLIGVLAHLVGGA